MESFMGILGSISFTFMLILGVLGMQLSYWVKSDPRSDGVMHKTYKMIKIYAFSSVMLGVINLATRFYFGTGSALFNFGSLFSGACACFILVENFLTLETGFLFVRRKLVRKALPFEIKTKAKYKVGRMPVIDRDKDTKK